MSYRRLVERVAARRGRRGDLRYLRREGNRRVRARRRRKTALRVGVLVTLWTVASAGALTIGAVGIRWVSGSGRFPLKTIVVKGTRLAQESEIQGLMSEWMGVNLLNIGLLDVEKSVRAHPWIGQSGWVRIQRRLPGTLVITVREREAVSAALVGGVVVLLDELGLPIDRFGPRYAGYDFPIIRGVDSLIGGGPEGEARLRRALAEGVRVTRTLASREPAFYDQVSEIDVSQESMVVLKVEGEAYDLRVSGED
ncbi:MAG: cell division protein FtsQ/DivIB, partial [Candidatus Rokuibacteriota bacterium]